MAIDPYAKCPGGKDKKVKFCCPDLLHELERIGELLDADQRQACHDYIVGLQDKFPDRACLLTALAAVQSELGLTDQARATVDRVLATAPDNAIALAESALLKADEGDLRSAVLLLHRAIAASQSTLSPRVYEAMAGVTQYLLAAGQAFSARAHVQLMLDVNPRDTENRQVFLAIERSEMPLLLKDWHFPAAPEAEPLHSEYMRAVEPLVKADWEAGEANLARLTEAHPAEPIFWRALATLRGWLLDMPGAAQALRQSLQLDLPLDDAVEVTALVRTIEPGEASEMVDELRLTYTISDVDALGERLAADRRFVPMHVDPRSLVAEGEPPPRAVISLLDRPLPATGVGLRREDVPCVLGQVLVFGRQTDRPPRLELDTARTSVPDVQRALDEAAGGLLELQAGEEIVGAVGAVDRVLGWRWLPPGDTPAEHLFELETEQLRHLVLEVWPGIAQRQFDDQSPEQLARDPAQHMRLLAAVLLLELGLPPVTAQDLANDLRARLGLPRAALIDPTQLGQRHKLSLVRIARLDCEKLSDADLGTYHRRVLLSNDTHGLWNTGREVVRRKDFHEPGMPSRAETFGHLAAIESRPQSIVDLLTQACQAADEAKLSAAPWLLALLQMRLRMGAAHEALPLIHRLRTRHLNEPGVVESLTQMMMAAGVVGPDGQFRSRPEAAAASLVLPGGESAEPGKLWTPGSEPAAQGKSALWVPGMD